MTSLSSGVVRFSGVSWRFHRRTTWIGVLVLVALAAVWFTMLVPVGGVMSVSAVLRTLSGHGDIGEEAVLYGWQLPRALTAVGVELAIGMAGAVFQSVTRNPLGSPDILGVTTGSATGGVLVVGVLGTSVVPVWAGALVGGLLTSVVMYLIAYERGIRAYRLVLVGIGLNAMLLATNTYVLSRSDFDTAKTASNWLLGSVDGRGWGHVIPLAVGLAVLAPVAFLTAPSARVLGLGDDHARSLGLPLEARRLALLAVGIGLTGMAVAAAGPIGFVALAAPQLARLSCGRGDCPLLPSALFGALILAVADVAATRLTEHLLPVGVVTGAVGGCYLAVMLYRRRV